MPLLVKICGLKTPEAIDVALESGADEVGFVFFGPSPRNVGLGQARALGEHVRGRARKVALTVDANDETLRDIVAALRPDMLQLHGKETPERALAIKDRFRVRVMKAIPVASESDPDAAKRYLGVVDWLMFDAKPPKDESAMPGGNARAFDWRILSARRWPMPWMLSGGLDPDNLAEAASVTRAPALDVSSGVESAPGVKDPAKIRLFLARAQSL
jgi:phosphoribosylanthranilate isomerase